MTANQIRYRKLAGASASALARTSLWLGPDHVLSVTSTGFSEEYKRFYLKDIQAILIRESSQWVVVNWILGGLASLFLLLTALGALLEWSFGAMATDVFLLVFFVVPLLVNIAAGRTCICQLRTAVQTERLYSLSRRRTALRVAGTLRQEIEAAQGTLSPENAEALWLSTGAADEASWANTGKPRLPATPQQPARQLKPYQSRAHEFLFAFLLIDMLHTVADVAARSMAVHVAGTLIGLGLIISAVTALIKQQGTDLPRGIRRVVWATVGYLAVSLAFWTVYNMYLSLRWAGTSTDYWDIQRYVATVDLPRAPVLLGWLVICAFTSGILALCGLLALRKYRRAGHAPPHLPDGSTDGVETPQT